jgi:transmembrane sensor
MEHQQQQSNDIKALLKRYLEGTASPVEKERVACWYSTLDDQLSAPLSPAEREALGQTILLNIHRKTIVASGRVKRKWISYAAAALLLLAGTGGFIYTRYHHTAPLMFVHTEVGSSRRVILPDSSTVVMNAGSTLEIPAGFGRHERNVTLSGEAYFDIRPDPARPFRVHHGKLTTTVLGTAFNIRAYPGDENTKVAVVSGRVQVEINGTAIRRFFLEHHESLQYDIPRGTALKGREDTARIGQWQRKVLDFNGYTLAGMVAELQRQYPVVIQLNATPDDTTHYNIIFRQEKIDNILKVLAGLTGITYKDEKGKIIIYSKTYAK